MKFFDNVVQVALSSAQKMSRKKVHAYLGVGISLIFLISVFFIYQIHSSLSTFRKRFSNLASLGRESEILLQKNALIEQKEQAIAAMVKERKLPKGLKFFLEDLVEKGVLTIGGTLADVVKKVPIPGVEGFEEERASFTMKAKSMEKIVNLLVAFRAEPVIVLRELEISEENKELKASIVIGARKAKG